jgi:tRNA-binding EMAP/Myf-like protein
MTIDEFQKMDLRVGTVLTAEGVEGSEKLLKLSVDIGEPRSDLRQDAESVPANAGSGTRQILSGIAKSYAPEDLVGKQVVVIANLEPRMMMGFESQGMILAANGESGEPVLLMPLREVPPGAKIT